MVGSGFIFGSLWGHDGIILGSFWGDVGIILRSYWCHVGLILASCWHPRISPKMLRTRFWLQDQDLWKSLGAKRPEFRHLSVRLVSGCKLGAGGRGRSPYDNGNSSSHGGRGYRVIAENMQHTHYRRGHAARRVLASNIDA